MRIEIAKPDRMAQSGSSLLRLLQNESMPILDLLVREATQNSLDARKSEYKYVNMDYSFGEFDKESLNNELEGITEALNKRYSDDTYTYLAIRDTNTEGLTGKLHFDDVKDNNYGNLLKLVYEISKAQSMEGAGGSWGLGKTVYYRVGIGLVVFYSRIRDEGGWFESRLAVSFVEDELSDKSIIPAYQDMSKRGIAWWGDEIGENKTQPLTDEAEIEDFLSIFDIEPYDGEETGTTIIIPYIDEERLLQNAQVLQDDEQQAEKLYWMHDIEEYLRIAVQRWYAPRLNNPLYNDKRGGFLKVSVNDVPLKKSDMEPVFQVVQGLYNRAINAHGLEDILSGSDAELNVEEINTRGVLDESRVGSVAYAKVDKVLLQMIAPHHKPSPYSYVGKNYGGDDKNRYIVGFTRKPGMIVSYEDKGDWVDESCKTDNGEFIIAIFVLNTKNKLKNTRRPVSLEEYVRKSEMADHTSWSDYAVETHKLNIISNIQSQLRRKISASFFQQEEDEKETSRLGKMLGDLLLPAEGFGKTASMDKTKVKGGASTSTRYSENSHNAKYIVDVMNIKYNVDGMIIPMHLKGLASGTKATIITKIDSESGAISIDEWESALGLGDAFSIMKVTASYSVGKESDSFCITEEEDSYDDECIKVEMKRTAINTAYGLVFSSLSSKKMDVDFELSIKTFRRDLKPVFMLEKE